MGGYAHRHRHGGGLDGGLDDGRRDGHGQCNGVRLDGRRDRRCRHGHGHRHGIRLDRRPAADGAHAPHQRPAREHPPPAGVGELADRRAGHPVAVDRDHRNLAVVLVASTGIGPDGAQLQHVIRAERVRVHLYAVAIQRDRGPFSSDGPLDPEILVGAASQVESNGVPGRVAVRNCVVVVEVEGIPAVVVGIARKGQVSIVVPAASAEVNDLRALHSRRRDPEVRQALPSRRPEGLLAPRGRDTERVAKVRDDLRRLHGY